MCTSERERERTENVLFNDTLNTFYLQLYGVEHMVKDHSDSERGNPLLQHGLLFLIRTMVLLYAPSHRQDKTYHSLCYTSCETLAGTRNSSMGEKERLFFFLNDTLNTLYLRLCGVRHMVKYHSDSKRGNPLPPHGLRFPINSKGSFICTIPQTG